MKPLSYLLYILVFMSMGSSAFAADCRFDKTAAYGGYQIRVYNTEESCSLQTYQIIVQANGQTLKTVAKQGEPIKQMWVTDLDNDRLFEILVFSASVEAGEYGELVLYEWTGNNFSTQFMPPLDSSQQQGYRGFDGYRMYKNQIVHEFPIYQQGDKECCASGGKRQSIYHYRNNTIIQMGSNIVK